ncbi:amidohydrolase family protein [Clostridium sp. CX1]|uniref:amidohydrolase family protein n=1 Tax=Clostridium sp. CX1 TaxID=2978346 RepID=UPI0021C24FE3|nr:amidohydrolase family protein [Clostridium sp. CX1]MCT8977063.1 amidohydrolase family protein [Clostridium sp. CX1]
MNERNRIELRNSSIIDTHIHIGQNTLFNKKEWNNATMESKINWLSKILKEYKRNNITALRDGGDGIFASCLAREVARKEGITYRTPIFAICKKEYYGSFLGKAIYGIEDFKREFTILKENKLDHLKIILTGIVNFNQFGDVGEVAFTYDELEYMVKSAKEYGVPIMVHANGREGVSAAIKAGVDTIEHGFLISDKELYGMAEKGIYWTPTLSPLGNILDAKDSSFKQQLDIIREVYTIQVNNIVKAYELGLKVTLGSDAGAYRVSHSAGIFDEINHFINIGFSKDTVLKICFENGSSVLKI